METKRKYGLERVYDEHFSDYEESMARDAESKHLRIKTCNDIYDNYMPMPYVSLMQNPLVLVENEPGIRNGEIDGLMFSTHVRCGLRRLYECGCDNSFVRKYIDDVYSSGNTGINEEMLYEARIDEFIDDNKIDLTQYEVADANKIRMLTYLVLLANDIAFARKLVGKEDK